MPIRSSLRVFLNPAKFWITEGTSSVICRWCMKIIFAMFWSSNQETSLSPTHWVWEEMCFCWTLNSGCAEGRSVWIVRVCQMRERSDWMDVVLEKSFGDPEMTHGDRFRALWIFLPSALLCCGSEKTFSWYGWLTIPAKLQRTQFHVASPPF